MRRDDLQNITDQHYQKMKDFAAGDFHDLNRHSIHQFRVEYKKLRAFLRLLSANKGNNKAIKVSNNLKRTYKLAGQIRDLQLQIAAGRQSTNNRIDKPASYRKVIRRKIHKQEPELIELLTGNPIENSKSKTDSNLPDTFTGQDYTQYLEYNQKRIHSILGTGEFNNKSLHSIRKILKDLFYNSNALMEANSHLPSVEVFGKIKINPVVEKILDDLGVFQDQCSSLAFLRKQFSHGLCKKDKRALTKAKTTLLQARRGLKRKIVDRLHVLDEPVSIFAR